MPDTASDTWNATWGSRKVERSEISTPRRSLEELCGLVTICCLMNAFYRRPEIDSPVNHKKKKSLVLLSALKYENTKTHIKRKTE